MPVKNTIKFRRDTANNWTTVNPVLANGEPGFDSTNNKFKFGDGVSDWANLPYQAAGNSSSLANGASVLSVSPNGNVRFSVANSSNLLVVAKDVSSLDSTGGANVNDDRVFANTSIMSNGNSTFDFVRIEGNLNTLNPSPSNSTVALSNLTTSNSVVYVSGNNILSDTFDIGIVGNYSTGGPTLFQGFYRDATDFGAWKVFDNLANYPNNSVINTAGITSSPFAANNLTGGNLNVSSNIVANIMNASNIVSGDASNITNIASSTRLVGGTSNIVIEANSNVRFSVKGVSNVAVITDKELQISNSISITGTSNFGPATNVSIVGGTIDQVITTDGNGNLQFAQVSADRIVNGTSNIQTSANSTTFVSVDGSANVMELTAGGITSTIDFEVTGNITGKIFTSNIINGDITANSNNQSNIQLVGTLDELQFDGDPTGNLATNLLPTGQVVFSNGIVSLGSNDDLHIIGGLSGQLLNSTGGNGVTFQDNDNFPGAPWRNTSAYGAGQVVRYLGSLYIANGPIPLNTAFTVGSTGATWSPLSQATSMQRRTISDFAVGGFINVADITDVVNLTITQTTPGIFISLPDPGLGSGKTRVLIISNDGTASLTLDSVFSLSPGYAVIAVWTGISWQFAAPNPALSNWIFTESATGLYYTGKSGSIYSDDTNITQNANVQVPLSVDGVVAANLSGSGNLVVFGGGIASMTGNSSYTGRTQIKNATEYKLIDNGYIGTATPNISTGIGGTKTIRGTVVTHDFTSSGVMLIPETPIPAIFNLEIFTIGGGGGGGSGATFTSNVDGNGTSLTMSAIGGAGGGGGEVKYTTSTVRGGTKISVTVGEGGIGGLTRGDESSNTGFAYNNGANGNPSIVSFVDSQGTPVTITSSGGFGGPGGGVNEQKDNTTTNPAWTTGRGGNAASTIAGTLTAAVAGGAGTTTNFDNGVGNATVVYGAGGGGGGASINGFIAGATGGNSIGGNGGAASLTGDPTAGANGVEGRGAGGGGGAGAINGRAGSPGGTGGAGRVAIRYTVNGGGGFADGGARTTSGNLTVHTYTTTDVFQVPASATFTSIDYLAVGAGGAGGSAIDGNTIPGFGGGAGGQVVTGSIPVVPGQVISINIGEGGNARPRTTFVPPRIALISGNIYDATGFGGVTSIDQIAADPDSSILPASGILKYNLSTSTGVQTVSVSFLRNGNTISQSHFTLSGQTLSYSTAVSSILIYANDDHDNLIMDADGAGIISRTNTTTLSGSNWDKFRGATEVTNNAAIDSVLTYPASGYVGTQAAVGFIPFPGTTSSIWVNKAAGTYKINNLAIQTLTTDESTCFGTGTSINSMFIVSDGINQFLVGTYNSTVARIFTANLVTGVLTSVPITLTTIPVMSTNVQTEEDMFGSVLFTVDGAISFYEAGNLYYGGTAGFKTDLAPFATTGRTAFTATSNSVTQSGMDVFGSIGTDGFVWFADWGHDNNGMFATGYDDNALGVRKTNISRVADVLTSATPLTVLVPGKPNGGNTTLGGIGLTTITAQGGNAATTTAGAVGLGASGGASGTGDGSSGGAGATSAISGISTSYGGGGGGGRGALGAVGGQGGSGGGGTGGGLNSEGVDGINGGGGGGAGSTASSNVTVYGGAGGAGIVVIAYPTPYSVYDATYSNTIEDNGNITQNSYNNQIFNGDIFGAGGYIKKKYTTTIFSSAVTITGNVNLEEGVMQIGNGSAGSMVSPLNIASNTVLKFNRNGTAVAPFAHSSPISGAGDIEFMSTNAASQSRYNFTNSNISAVTGNILVRANASLLATAAVFGTSNITIESTGAISVSSGNLIANIKVSGTGWTQGPIDGAISLAGGANIFGNVKLMGNATIAIANGTSNSTITGNISGNYSVTYKTPANTVSITLNANSNYTGTTSISNSSIVIVSSNTSIPNVSGLTIGTSSIFTPTVDVTIGNLSGNGSVLANSSTTNVIVGLNNMSSVYSGTINKGSIVKVGTGTLTITSNNISTVGDTGNTTTLIGNTTTVSKGSLVFGNYDTASYPPLGNITVSETANFQMRRGDIPDTTVTNGIVLAQNISGNGNFILSGVAGGTSYLHSPLEEWFSNALISGSYRYPNTAPFTGNFILSSNSRYVMLDDKFNPRTVIIESGSQFHLDGPWIYDFRTSNSNITLPVGNTYTLQGVVVGGGGGGGGTVAVVSPVTTFASSFGGAGGSIVLISETNRVAGTYPIVIGRGGNGGVHTTANDTASRNSAQGTAGSATTAFGYSAAGGAGGRNETFGNEGPAGVNGGGNGANGTGTGTAVTSGTGRNGTNGTVTFSSFNTSVIFSPGGGSGSKESDPTRIAIQTPLPGASSGGNSTVAPTLGSRWGCGGGGGGQSTDGLTTPGTTGRQGVGLFRYFENVTHELSTDFILRSDGWDRNVDIPGGIRSNRASWALTGNLTVLANSTIHADNKPLSFTGNVTGPGNLILSGNSSVTLINSNNTLTGTITINSTLNVGTITNACGYIVNNLSTISASANGLPTLYTTTGSLTFNLNGRMAVYSDGVSVLSRFDVGSFTVNGAWFIDMMSLTTTSGTYTLIGFTTPQPATVPSLGTNNTGKQVVFSYVDGTGLVVTLS